MNDYQDDPTKYIETQTLTVQAMIRAHEAEQAALRAKAEALEVAAKEQRFKDDIARQTELSVANNPQLLAQRSGFSPNRVVSSQSVGMVATKEIINETPVVWGGIQLGPIQAQEMVAAGQISRSEYQQMLDEALGARGYKAPSFR